MWIMTHFGILMPGLRPADTVLPGDNRTIQIRARRARDLNFLRDHFAPYLGPTLHLRGHDYQYRVYCRQDELADIMAKLALDVDYVHFKETASTFHGDEKLHSVYMRIWGVVLDAFEQGSIYARKTWGEPKTKAPRRQTRAERRRARRNGTGWKNAWVDEVDESAVSVTSDRNEYADLNREFRRQWWEDLGDN